MENEPKPNDKPDEKPEPEKTAPEKAFMAEGIGPRTKIKRYEEQR